MKEYEYNICKDILNTAVKTRRSVNKKLGLED